MSGFDTSQPITNNEVRKNVDADDESSTKAKPGDVDSDEAGDVPESR